MNEEEEAGTHESLMKSSGMTDGPCSLNLQSVSCGAASNKSKEEGKINRDFTGSGEERGKERGRKGRSLPGIGCNSG